MTTQAIFDLTTSFPVSSYASSNTTPLDAEMPALEETRQQVKAKLSSLNAEHARLKAEIDQLRVIAHTYDGILSPLRNIPYDILHKIIRHAVVDGLAPHDCFVSDANRFEGPWAYSQVSQRWRAITLSDTSLWSKIEITRLKDWGAGRWETHRETRGSDQTDALVEHLSFLLDRGGSHPLTVFMEASKGNLYAAWDIMKLLSSHRQRWYSLNLCLPYDLFGFPAFVDDMTKNADALRFLCLSVSNYDSDEDEALVAENYLPRTHSIRRLELDGITLGPLTTLPTTLTSLSLRVFDYSVLSALACARDHLRNLRILVQPTQDDLNNLTDEYRMILPNLKKLILEVGSDVIFLNYLTTPSLTVLRGVPVDDGSIVVATQFIERSQCRMLEELELRCAPYGACLEMLQLLNKACPMVTRITLEDVDSWEDNTIVGLLLETDEEKCYHFDRLTSLKVHHSGLEGSAGDALRMVIEERSEKLRTLVAIVAVGADSHTLPAEIVRTCWDKGVEVQEILTESGRLESLEDYRFLRARKRALLPTRCQES